MQWFCFHQGTFGNIWRHFWLSAELGMATASWRMEALICSFEDWNTTEVFENMKWLVSLLSSQRSPLSIVFYILPVPWLHLYRDVIYNSGVIQNRILTPKLLFLRISIAHCTYSCVSSLSFIWQVLDPSIYTRDTCRRYKRKPIFFLNPKILLVTGWPKYCCWWYLRQSSSPNGQHLFGGST